MDYNGLILWEKELSNPYLTGNDCLGINSSNNSIIVAAPISKKTQVF
jgi:hypothetical protein